MFLFCFSVVNRMPIVLQDYYYVGTQMHVCLAAKYVQVLCFYIFDAIYYIYFDEPIESCAMNENSYIDS